MSYPEPTVGAVIFNPDNKILLCRSSRWNNAYVIPGGHIELGEKMEDALKREIMEETGLKIYDIKLLGLRECIYSGSYVDKKHFVFIDYMCKTDSTGVTLNWEAEEYAWAGLDEINNYRVDGFTKALLTNLRDEKVADKKVEIFYNY